MISYRGITFRQAINARKDVFWPFIVVMPIYIYGTWTTWWMGLVALAMLSLPTVVLYFAWKRDNKPRNYGPPFRMPTAPPRRDNNSVNG